MLFIHEQLKQKKYPNCRKVAREFEVNWRTIHRDIQFMRDQLRLPIEYDKNRWGYYYTEAVEQFPGIPVSEAELFALLVAQKVVSHYMGTAFYEPLRSAFDSLIRDLNAQEVLHLRDLGEVMDIRLTGLEDLDAKTFQIVSRAVQQRRPLRFRYRKFASRGIEERSIHPYQLICANSRWYVVGHDRIRNAVRVFVLGRMKDPQILSGAFERPSDFNSRDYLKGSFGIFKGKDDFEVVIELDRWAADVMRGRKWHASQQVAELPGGEVRISFHLDNLEEIESWVLSWGAHATVVRPKALADRVLAAAKAMTERYNTPGMPPPVEGQVAMPLGIR